MKLHQRSLRETHFQATVTRFEFSPEFSQKSGLGIRWQRVGNLAFFYCESGFLLGVQPPPLLAPERAKCRLAAPLWEIHVHGASSRALTGEIGLLKFQNVFAEVSICPETMKLLQRSPRETHFQATVTLFEFSQEFSQNSGPGIWWQRAETSRFY